MGDLYLFQLMTLIEKNLEILAQLKSVLGQFTNEQYSKEVDVLSNNTIGKHARHVIEFYECLMNGVNNLEIDYDKRARNLNLEIDVYYILKVIDQISIFIEKQKIDTDINLIVEYKNNEPIFVKSTYFRELVYNIEHAIHHFAIISIAIKTNFQSIYLAPNFGTAYSTIQYQEKQCAQ